MYWRRGGIVGFQSSIRTTFRKTVRPRGETPFEYASKSEIPAFLQAARCIAPTPLPVQAGIAARPDKHSVLPTPSVWHRRRCPAVHARFGTAARAQAPEAAVDLHFAQRKMLIVVSHVALVNATFDGLFSDQTIKNYLQSGQPRQESRKWRPHPSFQQFHKPA